MNNIDKKYQELLQDILDNGIEKGDRTGTGTLSVFGRQIRHKMSEGFPLLTTKKMYFKGIATELLWFLRGDTNIKYLVDNDCHIWDGDTYKAYEKGWEHAKKVQKSISTEEQYQEYLSEIQVLSKDDFIQRIKTDEEFAKKRGELGPIYGRQWRNWGGHKEIKNTGFLHKTDKGWVVKWSDLHSFANGTEWMTTLIQDSDQSFYTDEDEGRKVNYKSITLGYNIENYSPNQVTKVIDDKFDKYIGGIDQISNLINEIKTNPDSRRLMVSAWNPADIESAVLPPCHYGFQVYTRELSFRERMLIMDSDSTELINDIESNKFTMVDVKQESENYLNEKNIPTRAISLGWNQRSVDSFLGLPFNIASYGLLLEIIAKVVNMVPEELIGNLVGDTHLYLNHLEQAKEQIKRESYKLPKLKFSPWFDNSIEEKQQDFVFNEWIESLKIKDFSIEDYQSQPSIKAPLSN